MNKNGSLTLEFPRNDAGEDEGLGHAGIETYKDDPFASVARESGQNSLDARSTSPVEMRFDMLSIPRHEYPALAQHVKAMHACRDRANAGQSEKEIDFFSQAISVLDKDEINVLSISDANTTGLVGPSVPGTPFHSLVKGAGISSKESETSGGSFGIGKNAAFAVSELQTVFYSTLYRDKQSGNDRFLAQGKTVLMSHRDEQGIERRQTGYWGRPNFSPIEDPSTVPAWLRRTAVGTSVHVVGFRFSDDWAYHITASLIQNFFVAISRGEIRFLVDNSRIDINPDTLPLLFDDEQVIAAATAAENGDDLDFARNLYKCLLSGDSVRHTVEVTDLGKVAITLLLTENLPKRVQIIRNGMAITESLESFGDKLSRFPMYREFVALVEPIDDVGSALFKKLENPRHNALSAERLSDPQKRARANKAMKSLAKVVRETIKSIALPPPQSIVSLDELSEFFADEQPSERPPQPSNEEQAERVSYTVSPPPRKRPTHQVKGADGDSGRGTHGHEARSGVTSKRKRRYGTVVDEGSGKPLPELELVDVRNTRCGDGSPWHRRLLFTPGESCRGAISVLAAGLDTPERLAIVASDTGDVSGGVLRLTLEAGHRLAVQIALTEPYPGPIEIVANGLSTSGEGA
jgi:hypothetical protein